MQTSELLPNSDMVYGMVQKGEWLEIPICQYAKHTKGLLEQPLNQRKVPKSAMIASRNDERCTTLKIHCLHTAFQRLLTHLLGISCRLQFGSTEWVRMVWAF